MNKNKKGLVERYEPKHTTSESSKAGNNRNEYLARVITQTPLELPESGTYEIEVSMLVPLGTQSSQEKEPEVRVERWRIIIEPYNE